MMKSPLINVSRAFVVIGLVLSVATVQAAQLEPVPLWPDQVPGETATLPAEADENKPPVALVAGRSIIRLGNVSVPTLTFYPPDPAKATGAAVMVCPGGGYSILAMDL